MTKVSSVGTCENSQPAQYEEEETYRYLIASDLSWRTLDIRVVPQ